MYDHSHEKVNFRLQHSTFFELLETGDTHSIEGIPRASSTHHEISSPY